MTLGRVAALAGLALGVMVVNVAMDDRFSRDVQSMLRGMPTSRLLPRFVHVTLTRQMLSQDPPDHTRLRKLVSQAFTPRRIEQLRGRIQAVCDELLDVAARSRSFDLVRGYASPIPVTVIAELLGIPREDRHRFHAVAVRSIQVTAPSRMLDIPIGLPYLWLLVRYFRKLFAERRARPGDDLVSALVQAEDTGDRLDEDELIGMSVLLLVAGFETTVNLIGSGALALLQHPDQRARFVGEPALAGSAIEELLRFTSPVEMTTPRLAREDVTLSSVTIPRGAWVMGVLGSANHDSRIPKRSISRALQTRMSPSARAGTSAWAPCWRAWKLRSCSPHYSSAFPTFASLSPPSPSAGASCCRCADWPRCPSMAWHEGAFYLPQAGEKRIEWYRYGDSNPGSKVENLVS